MHKDKRIFSIEQRLLTEPCDEFIMIWCGQDPLEGVFLAHRRYAFGDSQQEQVMVAQDDNRSIAKILDVAEDAQRIRAAVDEIADKPETI